jgi:cephalosporin hydroxylase
MADREAPELYHLWYYNQEVWKSTTFLGVPCRKSVSDLWNYQEILAQLQPFLVVEFGTLFGGSTLYLAEILKLVFPEGRVLTVDVSHAKVHPKVRSHPAIELLEADVLDPVVAERICALRNQNRGSIFWIVDDDHKSGHVYRELLMLRKLTLPGDYVIIEDGNVNGHPVLPAWGPGPYEALSQYLDEFPEDYVRDSVRAGKFGFTFAPDGFLIRQ